MLITINERAIRHAIKKELSHQLNEYLNKMASDAMRSLGAPGRQSQLSVDTHRLLMRDLHNPKGNEIGINKNVWLIHITTPEAAESIMRTGFKSKVQNLNFTATQYIDKELENNGLCFGCLLSDVESWGQITEETGAYDWRGVIFQANSFNAQSYFGYRNIREVVFSTDSAHNFLLLVPMNEQETRQWLHYHPDFDTDIDFWGGKVLDKNGKCLFRGDIDTLFARHNDFNSSDWLNQPLLTPSYAEDYLDTNLAQNIDRVNNPRRR